MSPAAPGVGGQLTDSADWGTNGSMLRWSWAGGFGRRSEGGGSRLSTNMLVAEPERHRPTCLVPVRPGHQETDRDHGMRPVS